MTSPLQFRTFTVDDTGNNLPYAVHVPSGYQDDPSKRWPLVLFLHGASERGEDPSMLTVHGPVKQAAQGVDLPFVMIAPQCPAYSTWSCELDGLCALIDAVSGEYRIDEDRVYCTGLSMGGTGTWALAARFPNRFAAVVPICGAWMPEIAPWIAKLPVWTFHGEDDSNIPIEHTDQVVEALKNLGSPARFTRYPGVGHDSWTRTYDDPEVYAWLLEQRRGG
ncbi:prolyl oligopeptidase family serine peptidase [Streptomyces sp. NPDC087856]|uniref:carboxylesterase family protein n=1 Tax=Streptomyces sp. NPDC087856 TaxID=3365811 RepID=UPI003826ECB4